MEKGKQVETSIVNLFFRLRLTDRFGEKLFYYSYNSCSKMALNVTNVYQKYQTKELLRRFFLASLSSNDTIANNAGEVTVQ